MAHFDTIAPRYDATRGNERSAPVKLDPAVAVTLQQRALTLRLDRAAAAIAGAFTSANIPSLLIKGPTTARLLYAGEHRSYSDIDLLVSVSQFDEAARTAEQLGFASNPVPAGRARGWVHRHLEGQERPLVHRADGLSLDLHRWFYLVPQNSQLFDILWAGHETMTLDGATVAVPNAAGIGLLTMLHAQGGGHVGAAHERVSADALRAVDQLSDGVWREIAALARQLGVARSVVSVLHERGGRRGAQLSAVHFPGTGPDRWLTAHLRTGSITAFQICRFRPYPWPKRLMLIMLPLVPSLRPDASLKHQAQSATVPNGRAWLLRDFLLAAKVAYTRHKPH